MQSLRCMFPWRLNPKIPIIDTLPSPSIWIYSRRQQLPSSPHTRRQNYAMKPVGCIPRNLSLVVFLTGTPRAHTPCEAAKLLFKARVHISRCSRNFVGPPRWTLSFACRGLDWSGGESYIRYEICILCSRERGDKEVEQRRSFWDVANFDFIAAPACLTGSAGTRPRPSGLFYAGDLWELRKTILFRALRFNDSIGNCGLMG